MELIRIQARFYRHGASRGDFAAERSVAKNHHAKSGMTIKCRY